MDIKDCKFYQIKKTVSENELIRSTIVELSANQDTPADVLDGTIEQITCQTKQFVFLRGTVEVRCNAMIGSDREVEYREYNNATDRMETKKKIETDWSPFQTTYTDRDSFGLCENGLNSGYDNMREFHRLVSDLTDEDMHQIDVYAEKELAEAGFTEVQESAMQGAMDIMTDITVDRCKASLPGDHYKDFSVSSANVDVRQCNNYTVPFYDIQYAYGGKTYPLCAYGSGTCTVRGTMPQPSAEDVKKNKNDAVSILKFISIGMSVLLAIFSGLYIPWLAWIVTILATATFISYKCMDMYDKKRQNRGTVKAKMDAVTKLLQEKGFAPLNDEETKRFNENYKTGHKHKKMTISDGIALGFYGASLVLFLIKYVPSIVSFLPTLILFVGLPVLLIVGLVIVPMKRRKK